MTSAWSVLTSTSVNIFFLSFYFYFLNSSFNGQNIISSNDVYYNIFGNIIYLMIYVKIRHNNAKYSKKLSIVRFEMSKI